MQQKLTDAICKYFLKITISFPCLLLEFLFAFQAQLLIFTLLLIKPWARDKQC